MDAYDVVIIGGGPAGLTAAIYAARARLKTLVIESVSVPGQAVLTADIENYPGFPEALNGFDLIDRFKRQAEKFDMEFKTDDVKRLKRSKGVWEINSGQFSLSVIVASGARPKKLGVPGEDGLRGRGVSYCAVCDGAFFKGKNIVLVGGGDTAIEEAVFLTKFADKVTVIHRRSELRATKILQERAFANKKIDFIWDSVVTGVLGEERVKGITIRNLKSSLEKDFKAEGVFIFVGYAPNTDFLKNTLKCDKEGYIIADENMKTSQKGVFAAGDVRQKILRQIVTAAGDGATAAISAVRYVEELKGEQYGMRKRK